MVVLDALDVKSVAIVRIASIAQNAIIVQVVLIAMACHTATVVWIHAYHTCAIIARIVTIV